jgi:uncharacterized spore protein YtfJ
MRADKITTELEKIGDITAKLGRVQTIFGDPIKLDTQTIVPVCAVVASFGAGGGGIPLLSGLGGGGDLRVLPIGFLHEQDGVVRFHAVDLPAELLHKHDRHAEKRP